MEDLVLSCLESRVEENRNLYARFLVGPFLRGDALTVATALRRVLLSSVESIGITALSIQGITHEFSTIAGVRESVLELSLNFGAIVLSYDKAFFQKKSFFDKLQIGYLQVQGPKVIYANDLKLPLGVKLVDPTQYIATVSKEGSIVLKFIISKRNNFSLGLVHQNIGSESHFENRAKQLSIVGEVGKKNIVRAKKTLPWPCLRALHPCRYLPYMPLACAKRSRKFARGQKEAKRGIQIFDLLGRAPTCPFARTNLRFVNAFASLSTSNRSFYKNGFAINSFSGAWLQNSVLPLLGVRFVRGNTNRKIYKVNKKSLLECKAKSFKRCMIDNGTSNTSLSFENKPKLYNQNGAVLPLSPVRRDLTSRNTDKSRRSSYKLKLCRKKEGGQSIRVKGSFAREALYSPCKSLLEICSFLEVAKQGRVQGKGKLLEKRNKSSYKAFHNLAKAKLYSVTESTCTCVRACVPVHQRCSGNKSTKRGVERALASSLHLRCTPLACAKRSRRFVRACTVGASKASKRICVNQREKGKISKKKLKFLDDSSGNSNVFQSNICLRNVIPLDLTVTPILKVNFVIEIDDEVLYLRQKIRERIILEVWTNGSIHPRQAVHDSSLRLLDMFASFRSVYQVTST